MIQLTSGDVRRRGQRFSHSRRDRDLPDRSVPRATDRTRTGGRPPSHAPSDVEGLPDLAAQEELLVVLRGIGAMMFLTSRRVIVARDGVERRPRSGIQSFPLETIRLVRLELGSAPSGRIAISTTGGPEAVSMFFDSRSLERAHAFIDVARPLIARQRRRIEAESARPPCRPTDTGTSDPT